MDRTPSVTFSDCRLWAAAHRDVATGEHDVAARHSKAGDRFRRSGKGCRAGTEQYSSEDGKFLHDGYSVNKENASVSAHQSGRGRFGAVVGEEAEGGGEWRSIDGRFEESRAVNAICRRDRLAQDDAQRQALRLIGRFIARATFAVVHRRHRNSHTQTTARGISSLKRQHHRKQQRQHGKEAARNDHEVNRLFVRHVAMVTHCQQCLRRLVP